MDLGNYNSTQSLLCRKSVLREEWAHSLSLDEAVTWQANIMRDMTSKCIFMGTMGQNLMFKNI